MPESVGYGGVLLDPDRDIADWDGWLKRLWLDDVFHGQCGRYAFLHSRREAIRPEFLTDEFVGVLDGVVDKPIARKKTLATAI
ncbi:MAG: hypothetical protein PHU14_02180 [Methylovulum sp.]|nr:hypothetical protein [Methylovulum sp.]